MFVIYEKKSHYTKECYCWGVRYAENRANSENIIVINTCFRSVVDRLSVAKDATASTRDTQHHSFDLDSTPITEASMAPKG